MAPWRRVKVRRLFRVPTQAEATEELERLWQSHRGPGIDTRIAVREATELADPPSVAPGASGSGAGAG
ncbi:hypothetical protein RB628_37290 [Streptomyces sp. ADMS]|uniref:hypothetical protein n=1 Tax=Streptomyces sp. ADMS TaxID=3071415 RepID=UPI00296ECC2E|nr:hypothetical protein [Streptomyces sp. ADMS]MDW4910825.1 hypothetical protein [Streptomyces sp. ADMS]